MNITALDALKAAPLLVPDVVGVACIPCQALIMVATIVTPMILALCSLLGLVVPEKAALVVSSAGLPTIGSMANFTRNSHDFGIFTQYFKCCRSCEVFEPNGTLPIVTTSHGYIDTPIITPISLKWSTCPKLASYNHFVVKDTFQPYFYGNGGNELIRTAFSYSIGTSTAAAGCRDITVKWKFAHATETAPVVKDPHNPNHTDMATIAAPCSKLASMGIFPSFYGLFGNMYCILLQKFSYLETYYAGPVDYWSTVLTDVFGYLLQNFNSFYDLMLSYYGYYFGNDLKWTTLFEGVLMASLYLWNYYQELNDFDAAEVESTRTAINLNVGEPGIIHGNGPRICPDDSDGNFKETGFVDGKDLKLPRNDSERTFNDDDIGIHTQISWFGRGWKYLGIQNKLERLQSMLLQPVMTKYCKLIV